MVFAELFRPKLKPNIHNLVDLAAGMASSIGLPQLPQKQSRWTHDPNRVKAAEEKRTKRAAKKAKK
jgi:hypothetical protein